MKREVEEITEEEYLKAEGFVNEKIRESQAALIYEG